MIDATEARQGLLPLNLIFPRSDQPRSTYDFASLEDLKDSIRNHGILEPLVVRPSGKRFEIVCGERRYRAACDLGLAFVPVRAIDMDEDRAFIVAIHENVHRDSLTPIDEARAYQKLLDRGRATSQRDLARLLNVSQARVSQRLALLRMPEEVIRELSTPDTGLTERHARILRQLTNDQTQIDLARRIVAEKLTVEQTASLVSQAPRRPRRGGTQTSWLAERGLRYRVTEAGLEVHVMSAFADEQAESLRKLAARLEREVSAVAKAPAVSAPSPRKPSRANRGSARPARA